MPPPAQLPFYLRQAGAMDAAAIRGLVWQTRINPTGLDWRRFYVAVESGGALIGSGQVKPHRDGSRELASIAVRSDWRGRGVASALIKRLLQEHPGVLYLTCRAELGSFYEKFGFQVVSRTEMPAYFRQAHSLFRLLRPLTRGNLLIMCKE